MKHVYVHIPFCARKCPYCDFNSHAGRDDEIDAYGAALLEEARRHARGAEPETIFVGGGTPTHLDAARLEATLAGLAEILGTGRLREFTVEANPGTLDLAKVRALRRAGVDRASLGVQSFDDRHLGTLGRIHDRADAVRSAALLREGGIERLSLDLILAVPGQTLSEQERDLARAVDLQPEHVSAYVLTIEEGTTFERMVAEGRMQDPDDERDLEHLHLAVDRLGKAGLHRYEISNFARAGAACLHNLAYWRGADWLGLGAGAHSHVQGRRWRNLDDPAAYASAIGERGEAVAYAETSDPATRLFEDLMMGLRLVEGVDLDLLRQRTGLDAREVHAEPIGRHVEAGLLVLEPTRLRLTDKGLDLASYVLRDLLPEDRS